ncbi:MAG TPA: PEP-CTERM sorting domain-containing protein [Vicinamibacterales bacterium]|nr:PEP-CTERM sorting domain-containing protein [Vicinamibacterales bacterium]
MRLIFVSFTAVVALSLGTLSASADPIRFDFEARVFNLAGNGPQADLLLAETELAIGNVITGYYAFDDETPDGAPGDPSLGRYLMHGDGPLFELSIAGYSLSSNDFGIILDTNYTVGTLGPILNTERSDVPGFPFASFLFFTGNTSGSDALPLVPPPLTGTSILVVTLAAEQDVYASLNAELTSLQATSVPEPRTLGLLMLGLAAVATRQTWARRPPHVGHGSRMN